MAARKAFLLRINPALWEELERWAAAEFRSVNGQIEYLLQRAVNDRRKGSRGRTAAEGGASPAPSARPPEAGRAEGAPPEGTPPGLPPADGSGGKEA